MKYRKKKQQPPTLFILHGHLTLTQDSNATMIDYLAARKT